MLILTQIVLLVAVIGVAFVLMRGGSNARHLAIRRILLMLFIVVAALSIIFPTMLSAVAQLVGVGRGTDLLLYGLVVAFLVFMSTTYRRFQRFESAMTKLARNVALEEAGKPEDFVVKRGKSH